MADETTTYQMTNARPENYWIAPDALYITLNAMGQPDYLQGNVSSGAVIMCYMRGIDGLSFDAGHNYRRWPLAVSPTYFNTSTPKYVYAAIPKSEAVNAYAQIVYPSEKIDLYGKNEKGEQIGAEGYYFVFLQGIISASVATDGTTQMRSWTQRVDCGSLASDEAIAAGGTDAWWKYSSVDDTVTFLKTIVKAVFDNITVKIATIAKLILNGHEINGVATKDTPATSDDTLVTPKYIKDVGDSKYLRKDQDDATEHKLTMGEAEVKGTAALNVLTAAEGTISNLSVTTLLRAVKAIVTNITFTNAKGINLTTDNAIINTLLTAAEAVIKTLQFTSGTGSDLTLKNLTVTGLAHFFELVIDKIKSIGGSFLATPADGFEVGAVEKVTNGYRLYWRLSDGEKKRTSMWKTGDQAICQNFNGAKAGTSTNVSNKYYWALVTEASTDNGKGPTKTLSDGKTNIDTDGNEYNYITISSTDCDGEVNPEVGDTIAQLGNRNDTAADPNRRGSAIYLSAYNSLDSELTAPLLAVYRNVGTVAGHYYDLAYYRKTYSDAKCSRFVGDFAVSTGQDLQDYVDEQVGQVYFIRITSSAGTFYHGHKLNTTLTVHVYSVDGTEVTGRCDASKFTWYKDGAVYKSGGTSIPLTDGAPDNYNITCVYDGEVSKETVYVTYNGSRLTYNGNTIVYDGEVSKETVYVTYNGSRLTYNGNTITL